MSGASINRITFNYLTVIKQLVDHLAPLCKTQTLVYGGAKETGYEPTKDKLVFLLVVIELHMLVVVIVEADEKNIIDEGAWSLISEYQMVVFSCFSLLDPFGTQLVEKNLALGIELKGVVLEDDWLAGHKRWTSQCRKLGTLSIAYPRKADASALSSCREFSYRTR